VFLIVRSGPVQFNFNSDLIIIYVLSLTLSLSSFTFTNSILHFKFTFYYNSWTENKENKKLFFEQLGEWYTIEDSTTTTDTNDNGNNGHGHGYCLLQPNITCHYRDKPSIIPCTNSPPIVKNGRSFW
jgi:hypothetical protein